MVPGPKGLPIIGCYFQFDKNKSQHMLTEWSKKYGPVYKFQLLGKNIVVLNKAKLVRRAFDTGAISAHTNDRPKNISKYVYPDRKHIGLADLNLNTVRLRDILQLGVNKYLSGEENFRNKQNDTIITLTKKLLLNNTNDLNPDIYIKDFLSSLNSVLVGILRLVYINSDIYFFYQLIMYPDKTLIFCVHKGFLFDSPVLEYIIFVKKTHFTNFKSVNCYKFAAVQMYSM